MREDDLALPPGRWVRRKGGIYEFIKAVKLDTNRCGTDAGYRKHLRLGETTCESCRAAHRTRQADFRLVGRTSKKPPLKPCGTHAAHNRHVLKGEDPCAACVAGEREYQREQKARLRNRRKEVA